MKKPLTLAQAKRHLLKASATIEATKGAERHAKAHRDAAYQERDLLIAVLSRIWPAHLMPISSDETRRNWPWAVCVHTPSGLLAWNISEDTAEALYGHLERLTASHFDGCTRVGRVERLNALRAVEFWPLEPK